MVHSGAAVAANQNGVTQYDEEVGYDLLAVSVVDCSRTRAGLEATEFKVVSWRRGLNASDDEAESVSEGSGDCSDSESIASVSTSASAGPQRAQPQPKMRKQVVWRTLKEFRLLHSELTADGTASGSPPSFPTTPSWLSMLWTESRDRAESVRCDLDCYMKESLSQQSLAASRSFRRFLSPADRPDWPSTIGDIDLAVHDLPHASSATEWWYYNCHFKDAEGNDYSAFAAFFRVLKHTDKDTGVKSYAHALNWALTDVTNKRYVQECVLDKDSPEIVRKQLETGKVIRDPRLYRSYMEVLARGAVPLPDRMFSPGRDAVVGKDKLSLDFESASITKDSAGRYVLACSTPNGQTGVQLTFTPRKAPVRHGLDGVVKGHDGDDMFYYCISRCDVSGSFTSGGVAKPVAPGGQGWYDHEFGGLSSEEEVRIMNYAWTWAAIQFEDGRELSAAVLVDPRTTPHRIMETRAVVVDAAGRRSQPTDLSFTDGESWTSVRTFNRYPTSWTLSMPSAGIQLQLAAPFADQEFMTLIAKPGFWEGRVEVTGTMGGAPVKGVGYVERNGFTTLSELDGFFKAVGAETRRAVMEVYPDTVTDQVAIDLIANKDTPWYIDGVDKDVFRNGIINPVRYITDMGGKSWRSYGALACIDVVGGDARKYTRWLSMPEFLHVGSLIIDDIEDRSTKRRGVDCAHIKYGEPISINAGCAAYFQGHQLLIVPGLTDKQLNSIYDYYFSALRAGHAGQALDIAGLGYCMDEIIATGNQALAESRILAIHRLKTAVPAASLARMGALVGGGTPEQIEAIGRYYESVGLAFQIMDDVLNLRGIYSGKADKTEGIELKTLGEDITAGKITMPVVKAIGLLSKAEMTAIYEIIKSQPAERAVVQDVIARLEACGAIDACIRQAQDLVEDSWFVLQPLLVDSFSKVMLRAFGWFVSESAVATLEAPGSR